MQYMIDFRSQFELGTSIFTSHEPYNKFFFWVAKCFITELASPYVQSAQGSRGEKVRDAGLATCCNYFSKKKKSFSLFF